MNSEQEEIIRFALLKIIFFLIFTICFIVYVLTDKINRRPLQIHITYSNNALNQN